MKLVKRWSLDQLILYLLLAAVVAFVVGSIARFRLLALNLQLRPMFSIDLKRARFRSGDLLLFSSSRDEIVRRASTKITTVGIKLGGKSPFTHVAVVYVHPTSGCEYMWETSSGSHDGRTGARLTPLRAALQVYKGRVLVRSLHGRIDQDAFTQLISDHYGKPYSFDFLSVFFARMSSINAGSQPSNCDPKNRNFFCTSLVAHTLQVLGICDWTKTSLPGGWPFPADFQDSEDSALSLSLCNGMSYSPATEILRKRGLFTRSN